MFDFIKNYENIITILVLVLVIVLVVLFIRFEFLRIAIITIISILYTLISIWCGFQINNYYSSTGGILGEINSIVKPNEVVVQNLAINFKYSEFTLKEDGLYSLETSTSSVFDLTRNTGYIVLVNSEPCNNTNITEDYVSAEYKYSFENAELEEQLVDTLYIKIGFHEKTTIINVYTYGSSTAVDYWNNYFYLNDFIIEIKENPIIEENVEITDEYLIASADFYCVRFYENQTTGVDNYLTHKDYYINSKISSVPSAPLIDGYDFVGWVDTYTGEIVDFETFIVSRDTYLCAKYEIETCAVNLYVNGVVVETINVSYGSNITESDFAYELPNGYKLAVMENSTETAFVNPATDAVYITGNADLYIYKYANIM